MKLHLLQRLACKLGVPIKILNILAQECYGYAIPNAEGKYPDWWYEQQNVPTTFRDCEVPKEVLKNVGKKRNRGTKSPKVYVRVRHGKVVEVVSNSALQSEPNLPRYTGDRGIEYPETVFTRERFKMRTGDDDEEGVKEEEIVRRVVEMRKNDGGPRMTRSTSVPTFPPSSRGSDIMSLLRDDRMPPTRRLTVVPEMGDPGSLFHDTATTGHPFYQPHRSVTAPNSRFNTFPNSRSVPPRVFPGPSLPSNPRPVRHERSQTSITDDTILRYYSLPASNGDVTTRSSYRQRQERNFKPMNEVEEDAFTEWGGYDGGNDDEDWEDEEEFGRKEDYRRIAAEGLREYRREY